MWQLEARLGSGHPGAGGILRAAAFLALVALPVQALPQDADSDRNYPNVLAPLYSFGRSGSEPGALRLSGGLAVGKDDLLYVADTGNHRIQMFTMNGLPRGGFGSPGTGQVQFLFPSAIAVGPEEEVYVADLAGRIQVFSAEGRFLRAWEGLRGPRGIAVSKDRIYVTESDLHRIRIFPRTGGDGASFGGLGSKPGRFLSPAGIAIDEDGAVYVADSGNHRIQKLDSGGKPLAQWGAWGSQAGFLSYPAGLGYARGRVTVADEGNHRVQVFDRSGVFLRQWGAAPEFLQETRGRFQFPQTIAVTPSGGLTVVGEPVEDRIQVFANRDLGKSDRLNSLPWWDSLHTRMHAVRLAPPPPGSPAQIAGCLAAADVHAVFFFDVTTNALGPLVAAGGYGPKLGELNGIGGVAMDPEGGRAFVGDRGNRRIVIFDIPRNPARKELFENRIKVVGARAFDQLVPPGQIGYSPEAAVPGPICRDAAGRIYIHDRANAAILVCGADLRFEKRVPVSPTIQDFAVAVDGTILATDPVRGQVVRYDAEGKEKSAWGRRAATGEDAFQWPFGIAVDDQGCAYVTDAQRDAVMKFDREGRFLKRWGGPGRRFHELVSPRRISFYKPDRLLVEDLGNHRAQLCNTEGEFLGNYVAGGLATPLAIR